MKRILCIILFLFLLNLTVYAEIPCQCSQEACSCFIQLGDEGPAVEFIRNSLMVQGYLHPNDDASSFDEKTWQAMIAFQTAHDLSPTGMMDDVTLTLLLWGMSP